MSGNQGLIIRRLIPQDCGLEMDVVKSDAEERAPAQVARGPAKALRSDMPNPAWLHRLFQPQEPLPIAHARLYKVTLRTAHLMAISVLVGGHAFSAPVSALKPLLYVAIATGAGMILLEAGPTLHFVFEGWGLLLLGKLVLLCCIPFAWKQRFPILLAVVAIASIGSHMPRSLRHYSLLYRRVIK